MKLQSIDWRPEDPAILANPYPIFSRMRDEDPCYWSDRLRSWVITRYDDVKAMCLDKERLSSDRLRPFFQSLPGSEASRISEIIRYLSLWMVFKDPPEHTRLRKLTAKVFSARAMQAMRPPCLVIMAMLGVPVQALAQLKRLSDEIALFIGSSRMSSDKYDTAEQATQEMAAFFKALIGERRAHPKTDAISELVHLLDGEDRFSDDELVASCILMLFAGHETTTNLIANGVYALIHFPDAYQALRNDPTLAQNAVEELLRYDGPSGSQVRVVCRSFALHGKELQAGQRVFMMLNAANRDPRAYPDPDRLDLSRDGAAHLAFGYGSHICLGFPLARLEGMVAIPALLNRFRSLELLKEPPWINSLVFRGMQQCLLRGVR
ncbi:MAG: cytochrome P450 [Betaproteobacteria bacterium]|nr:cytochrome P450 [Betaproteobacteria bacterium]